jgi:hypothetical protein
MTVPQDALELDAFIADRDSAALRERIKNLRASALADVREPLSPAREAVIFRLLPISSVRVAAWVRVFHSYANIGPCPRSPSGSH